MKYTIKIKRTANGYTAQYNDPIIAELFGSDTITTAYTPVANPKRVLSEIAGMNPQYNVILVK